MGAGQSSQTSNINEFLSQITVSSITTNQTSCQATATINQNLVISDDPYAEATKCNQVCASNSAPAGCYAVCSLLAAGAASSSFTAGDISQTAQVTLSATCKVDYTVANAVQQDVANQITQAMNKTNDDLGTALKGVVSTISKSSDSTVNQNTVKNLVNSTFTTTNLQNFVDAVTATQSTLLQIGVTTAKFGNISQAAAATAMGQMLATNSTINSATQAVTNAATQQLTQTSEILPGLQSFFASVGAGIGSLFSGWAIFVVIGVVVVALLACCLLQ